MKYCTGTYKQVYYQLIAPIFDFTVLLHVSATACSHPQGATLFKDIYSTNVHGAYTERLHIGFSTLLNHEESPSSQDVWMQHFKRLIFFL